MTILFHSAQVGGARLVTGGLFCRSFCTFNFTSVTVYLKKKKEHCVSLGLGLRVSLFWQQGDVGGSDAVLGFVCFGLGFCGTCAQG